MSDPNWGMLSKAQDDNETIEEAIARLITVHNADEESHLAAGQSLQSHKAAEIIDHLAKSVLRDKLIFDRNQIDEHFASIDSWEKTAGVLLDAIMEMKIETTSVLNNAQESLIRVGDGDEGAAFSDKNPVFETRIKFEQSTSQLIYIIQGHIDTPAGFGFKVVNDTIYGIYFDDVGDEQSYSLGTITAGNFYILRAELVDGVSLKFFINGVEIYDFGAVSPADEYIYMYYYIKTTTTAIRRMYIKSFHWDADYST